MNKRGILLLAVAVTLLLAWGRDSEAYPRYKNNSEDPGSNCSACHGDFTGPTSPIGTVFPSDSKHEMHRSSGNMNTECDLCHTSGDGRNPFIGSSNGTGANVGRGCVGCHGREEDAPGRGAGLRQHHTNAGVPADADDFRCVDCHADANPANFTPVAESVRPSYYGTADTNADMGCNPTAASGVNENWSIGDFLGLDNDGDLAYDTADTDCVTTTPGETGGPTLTTPLLVASHNSLARQLDLIYGVACDTSDNTIVFGPLNQVSSLGYSGEQCLVGATGQAGWTYPMALDEFFFLVVGNNAVSEGSYGKGQNNQQRPPHAGNVTCPLPQDLSSSCD